MVSTDELKKKWKKDELDLKDIQGYISQYPPEMSEKETQHIADNLHSLYKDIREDRRGTHWSKALKEGRWIDAAIRGDLVISRGWNKIARFLHHVAPHDVLDQLQGKNE